MAFDRAFSVGVVVGSTVAGAVRGLESVADKSRRLGDTIARAGKRADRHREKLRALRAEQAKTGDKSGDLARRIAHVGEVLRRTTRHANQYKRELRGVQRVEAARQGRDRALRRGAVALGGAYVAARAFQAGFERERAALRLESLLAGPSMEADLGRALEHTRADVRRGRVLQGETELLQVQADLRGADLSAEVARAGSTLAGKIATVTGGTARDVASVLGDAYTIFGDEFEGDAAARLGAVGEVLAAAQTKYKFEVFSDLGDGLKEVAGAASSSQLPLDQTAVALGLLSKAGLGAGRGGTALKAVLRQLPKAADELGISIARLDGGDMDLEATLAGVAAELNQITDIDARKLRILELFGDEGEAGLSPLLVQLGQFREGVEELADPVETIDEKVQRWLESSSGQAEILRNNLALLRDVVSGGLVPAFGPAAGMVTQTAVVVGQLVEEMPVLGRGLRLVAGVAGSLVFMGVAAGLARWGWAMLGVGVEAFIAVAGGIKRVVVGTIGTVLRFSGAAKLASVATWLWNAALLANPVIAIATAVVVAAAIIGGAVYLIYRNWEPVKGFFGDLWGAVTARFKTVVEAWSAVFTDFSWGNVGKAVITTLVDGVIGSVGLLYDGLKWVFDQSVGRLIPGSDTKEGPLSRLTASGGATLGTMGAGVLRRGPGPLRRPLGRQLAAASPGLALAVPAAALEVPPGNAAPLRNAAAGAPVPSAGRAYVDRRTVHITINQQPGEDASALADRVLREMDRRRGRSALDDLDA